MRAIWYVYLRLKSKKLDMHVHCMLIIENPLGLTNYRLTLSICLFFCCCCLGAHYSCGRTLIACHDEPHPISFVQG